MFITESVMTRDVKIKVGWYSSEHRWKRKNLGISAENDWISMRAQPGIALSCLSFATFFNLSQSVPAPQKKTNFSIFAHPNLIISPGYSCYHKHQHKFFQAPKIDCKCTIGRLLGFHMNKFPAKNWKVTPTHLIDTSMWYFKLAINCQFDTNSYLSDNCHA